jgi:hypothetical protein
MDRLREAHKEIEIKMETKRSRDVDGKRWREIEVEKKTKRDREKKK